MSRGSAPYKRPTMADVVDAANEVLALIEQAEAKPSDDQYRRNYLFNARRRALVTVRQQLHESSRGWRGYSINTLNVEAESLRKELGTGVYE